MTQGEKDQREGKKITVASRQEAAEGLLERTVCEDKQDRKQSDEGTSLTRRPITPIVTSVGVPK